MSWVLANRWKAVSGKVPVKSLFWRGDLSVNGSRYLLFGIDIVTGWNSSRERPRASVEIVSPLSTLLGLLRGWPAYYGVSFS